MGKAGLLIIFSGLCGTALGAELPPSVPIASYVSGDQLSEACSRGISEPPGNAFLVGCKSYVAGVVDALRMADSRMGTRLLCLAPGTQLDDLTRLVIDFLGQHPDQAQRAGQAVVYEAVSRAFPCEEQASQATSR